jgi:REP element-mobilizing transposase RayT
MNAPGDKSSPGNVELQLGIFAAAPAPQPPSSAGRTTGSKAELELGAPSALFGWYSRGYLPHRDQIGLLQFITFRLADSLPQEKLEHLTEEVARLPVAIRDIERRKRIEHWLDAGLGCCALRHPRLAKVVEQALLRFDGDRYHLLAWCIMPNHVHALLQPTHPLARIVQSWKSYTGRWALTHNAELELGVPRSQFWMREYWDRFMRDENHLRRTIDYIHENPVKAGLCTSPESWRWSSARLRLGTPSSSSAA